MPGAGAPVGTGGAPAGQQPSNQTDTTTNDGEDAAEAGEGEDATGTTGSDDQTQQGEAGGGATSGQQTQGGAGTQQGEQQTEGGSESEQGEGSSSGSAGDPNTGQAPGAGTAGSTESQQQGEPAPVDSPASIEAAAKAAPVEEVVQLEAAAPPVEPDQKLTDAVVTAQPVEISQEEVVQLAALVTEADANRDRDHGGNNGGNGNGGHGGNGGGLCDRDRGPQVCNWDNWEWDHRGNPVVKNTLSIDIDIVLCDPRTGQFFSVRVAGHSSTTIQLPGGAVIENNIGFVVQVAGGAGGFSGNVAFGLFNEFHGGNCGNRCAPAYRNEVQLDLRFRVGNNWYTRPAHVYDCGCVDQEEYRGHRWDRVWINNRKHLGTWVTPKDQPRYFVPQYVQPTPLSTSYEDYDCDCGVNPTAASGNLQDVTNYKPLLGVGAFAFLVVAGGGYLLLRPKETASVGGSDASVS